MPITSTRKKDAKPSMISMLLKAAPGSPAAEIEATRAAKRATMEKGPKILRWSSLVKTASMNMTSTPAMVRIISGRMRKYSTPVGKRLAGIGHLASGRPLFAHVQDSCVFGADRGQEGLGVGAHPQHQEQQREDGGPLASG